MTCSCASVKQDLLQSVKIASLQLAFVEKGQQCRETNLKSGAGGEWWRCVALPKHFCDCEYNGMYYISGHYRSTQNSVFMLTFTHNPVSVKRNLDLMQLFLASTAIS